MAAGGLPARLAAARRPPDLLLVLSLPIILLALVAILLASAVFAVLALAHRTIERFQGRGRGLLGRRDGRENVRVIERRDQ